MVVSDGNIPYIVPMNFGYQDNCLYFHCAIESKKLDVIRQNDQVCFELETDVEIITSEERVCKWSTEYRSIIGFGKAFIIDNWREKATALNIIIRHYGANPYSFSQQTVEKLSIFKIEIASMTGKKAYC